MQLILPLLRTSFLDGPLERPLLPRHRVGHAGLLHPPSPPSLPACRHQPRSHWSISRSAAGVPDADWPHRVPASGRAGGRLELRPRLSLQPLPSLSRLPIQILASFSVNIWPAGELLQPGQEDRLAGIPFSAAGLASSRAHSPSRPRRRRRRLFGKDPLAAAAATTSEEHKISVCRRLSTVQDDRFLSPDHLH